MYFVWPAARPVGSQRGPSETTGLESGRFGSTQVASGAATERGWLGGVEFLGARLNLGRQPLALHARAAQGLWGRLLEPQREEGAPACIVTESSLRGTRNESV